MAFPNQSNNTSGIVGNQTGLNNQQLAALLSLLGQQPQANPTSSSFNPSYFSQLMNIASQSSGSQPTQQVSSSQTSSYVIVRTVDDPSVIEAQEVAMGVNNLFPSSDGKTIYMKKWNKEGLIDTDVFVSKKQPNIHSDVSPISELEKRVSALEASVNKLKKQKSSRTTKPKVTKTEVIKDVDTEEENRDG